MPIEDLASRFTIWDYVVFAGTLLISAGIGVFYGFFGGGQKTTSDFLMGGRQMGVFPVTLSLLASFLSAITLLGTPAEVYQFGTQYWLIFVAYCFCIPLTAYVYMPIFYRLNVTSAYEYLELRFSRGVRLFASGVYIMQMVLYLSVVSYAPALALNQVTGIHVWGSVAAIAVVCTFYTTVGGMKAVMWTDAFQVFLMFGSVLVVIIKGCYDVGGGDEVWRISDEGKRIDFFNWDPNPLVRHTVWTVSIGGTFTWLATYSANQAQIQRYLCCPNLRTAQIALWWNLIGLTALMSICCFGGLVIYARYYNCDPLTTKFVTASDQVFPLFVMDTVGKYSGLPGLFVSGIFSGALSTLSSGLNSLSAVALEDFIRPMTKNLPERKATLISKGLALGFGILCFALVAAAAQVGNVLQTALSIFGMVGGPLLGVFTLGMFFPWANALGAGIGLFTALVIVFWIGVGALVVKPSNPALPFSTLGCNETLSALSTKRFNMTHLPNVFESLVATTTVAPQDEPLDVYRFSYLYYSLLSILIVLVIGLIVSAITGFKNPEDVDPKLICPVFSMCCPYLPKTTLERLRFKVGDNLSQPPPEKKISVKTVDMSMKEMEISGVDNLGFNNHNPVDDPVFVANGQVVTVHTFTTVPDQNS